MNYKNNQTPPYHSDAMSEATGQARDKYQRLSEYPACPVGSQGLSFGDHLVPNHRMPRYLLCSLNIGICLIIVSWLLYLIFSISPVYAKEKQPLDITSDEVEYTKVKGKEVVIFTGHVVAIQETTTLKGDQLKLFPDENKAVATGRAWMKDEKQKMVLTGERIEYYHDRRYGMATGSPRLVSKKENFTLTSKKMEVFFPEDRFRATGKVKLVKDDMVATGKVLDYFNKEKKVILTGNPQIREKENLITGDKITFFVDEYRVIVEDRARIKFIPEEKE